jgi:alpha-L-rhamnosidase
MRPQPVGDLRFVRASHKSMYGTIESGWEIKDGQFHWSITIPVNTTATVHVPTSDPTAVREGGSPVAEANGLQRLAAERDAAVYRVGSGTYRFSAPYTRH